ncbi:hypothetical protein J3R30DRAFT_908108 [Lentinula aciculospora]|uniref:Uncharacterized protein n=1 Tax=Lentinula aciculospora TaxID=153920 RepID=A0A9W9AQC6_9AGAR|nr:hypothetical protein J3R30DRAFT_908108 [Lentinula aciculospora]
MISTTLLTVLAILALVHAQIYGPPPSSGSTTTAAPASAPSAPPDTQGQMNIDVAFNGNFVFHPTNITAPVGTLVTFWFPGGDIPHSVTQSSFQDPCTYLTANSSTGAGAGFDSGLTNAVQFTINVTDDQLHLLHSIIPIISCLVPLQANFTLRNGDGWKYQRSFERFY